MYPVGRADKEVEEDEEEEEKQGQLLCGESTGKNMHDEAGAM